MGCSLLRLAVYRTIWLSATSQTNKSPMHGVGTTNRIDSVTVKMIFALLFRKFTFFLMRARACVCVSARENLCFLVHCEWKHAEIECVVCRLFRSSNRLLTRANAAQSDVCMSAGQRQLSVALAAMKYSIYRCNGLRIFVCTDTNGSHSQIKSPTNSG